MKILNTQSFISDVHCYPGDELIVIWSDDTGVVVTMEAKITDEQTLDTAVLVEYTPAEAEALGFESALGVFAGKAEALA
jgi:hypothetical protein